MPQDDDPEQDGMLLLFHPRGTVSASGYRVGYSPAGVCLAAREVALTTSNDDGASDLDIQILIHSISGGE